MSDPLGMPEKTDMDKIFDPNRKADNTYVGYDPDDPDGERSMIMLNISIKEAMMLKRSLETTLACAPLDEPDEYNAYKKLLNRLWPEG